MKTFISLSIDNERPNESGSIVFQAETKEDAVLAVAIDMIDMDEIDDFEKEAEPGESISDYVFIWMFDDYSVMITEVKGKLKEYSQSKTLEFETWYAADLVPLLEKKYSKKK